MWTIIEQEESVGKGEKVAVRCKHVKFFPVEEGGEIKGFGKLGFLLLQVIIENEKGVQLKLKLNASGGIANPVFVIQQPDTFDHPKQTIGEGKAKKIVRDTLAKKVRVKGVEERFSSPEEFGNKLSRMMGGELAGEVLELFAIKLADILSAR